jgi:hypothetical protein
MMLAGRRDPAAYPCTHPAHPLHDGPAEPGIDRFAPNRTIPTLPPDPAMLSPAQPAPPRTAEHPAPPRPPGTTPTNPSSAPRHRRPWLRRSPALAAIGTLILAASLTFPTARPVAAYDGSLNTYACEPYYGPSWTNGETDDLYQATYSICANIPYGTYGQSSGYTYVSDFVPYDGQSQVWFYVQQNPDQYTQLQINGPPGGSNWIWFSYWQQNPNCWWDDQVNTWNGGPYWHATGYC